MFIYVFAKNESLGKNERQFRLDVLRQTKQETEKKKKNTNF